MDLRRRKILQAIIDSFIESAMPVGSKHITEHYEFDVSPATIRNEMAALEREGYIRQPHTSAGRVPTSAAYRMMVDQLGSQSQIVRKAQADLMRIRDHYYLKKTKEKLYDTVSILAAATENVSFATLPDKGRFFYIGISNILKKPEFMSEPDKVTRVIEILENDLANVISGMDITDDGAIYIGEENILPEFQSCSLLALPYSYNGFEGVMGILGSIRMNYAYNSAALQAARQLLTD